MSIVDDLVENLVERNAVRVSGVMRVELVDGGLQISGALRSVLQDTKKGKDVLRVGIPVAANVKVGELVVQLPPSGPVPGR